MKLTNESVAQALGWKHGTKETKERFRVNGSLWSWLDHNGAGHNSVPAFTTSLDTIVAAIEARGLMYSVIFCGVGRDRCVGTVGPHLNKGASIAAKTAPLALCASLLAFLEARR